MAKWNQESVIRGALRRAFARSPAVLNVKYKTRRESPRYKKDGSLSKQKKVEYQCAICKQWYGSNDVAVDHIEPVIPVNGVRSSWDMFMERLFCDEKNLQLVCSYKKKKFELHDKPSCHYLKTQEERLTRGISSDSLELKSCEDPKRQKTLGKRIKDKQKKLSNIKSQILDYFVK